MNRNNEFGWYVNVVVVVVLISDSRKFVNEQDKEKLNLILPRSDRYSCSFFVLLERIKSEDMKTIK